MFITFNEFTKPLLTKVKQIKREGKSTLLFMDFIDPQTYKTVEDLIYTGDQNIEDLIRLEKQPVTIELSIGKFSNRTSFSVLSVNPVK